MCTHTTTGLVVTCTYVRMCVLCVLKHNIINKIMTVTSHDVIIHVHTMYNVLYTTILVVLQWNLSIVDTTGCVLISEVDLYAIGASKLSCLERCPYFRG